MRMPFAGGVHQFAYTINFCGCFQRANKIFIPLHFDKRLLLKWTDIFEVET